MSERAELEPVRPGRPAVGHRIIKNLTTVVAWVVVTPVLLIVSIMSFGYVVIVTMATLATLFSGPLSFASALTAIFLNLLIADHSWLLKRVSRPGKRKIDRSNVASYVPYLRRHRKDKHSMRVAPAAHYRRLAWILLPGLFGVLVYSVLYHLQYWLSQDCHNEFVRWLVYLFPGYLPLAITWRLASLHNNKEFYGTSETVHYRDPHGRRGVKLCDVVLVNVERDQRIADEAYHEDDESQHLLMITSAEGGRLIIELADFNMPQREKIFRWLVEHLDSRVISSRSMALLGSGLAANKLKLSRKTDAGKAEKLSFTTMWENEMNTHISRTNYVPMELGQTLQKGRYTVAGFLNSGGFSTTYICDTACGARVVLKESSMPAGLADESRAQIAEMFAREARLLQRCTHERIARILDFFHENDREYLVLQLIDGVPLSGLMHRSDGSVRVSEKQVRLWAWQLTEFLVHLHGLDPPIIHRDFTPDNLLLHQSGDIYLIDFGAANEFIGQATGTLIGKQSYIPLEQLQGKALPQSDIYALGGTIYFLLSGCDPLPLTELHPREDGYECSVELDELVGQCTRLDKDQRISSATEVLRQLSSFVG